MSVVGVSAAADPRTVIAALFPGMADDVDDGESVDDGDDEDRYDPDNEEPDYDADAGREPYDEYDRDDLADVLAEEVAGFDQEDYIDDDMYLF
jgi:hypothetical protein